MPTVITECLNCKVPLRIPLSLTGKVVRCSKCGHAFQVQRNEPLNSISGTAFDLMVALAISATIVALGVGIVTLLAEGSLMLNLIVLGIILLCIVPTTVATYIGGYRTCGAAPAFLFGLTLGWLGVAIVLCFPRDTHYNNP